MNKMSASLRLLWALWLAALCAASGGAWATPTYGTRLNNWCATQPVQSVAPQQSKPYLASGNSCALCHTSSKPSRTDLNTLGTASKTCTGTTCGATVNPSCVATAPGSASITAPAAGTSVALGQSLTFTAAATTNPDGFPLTYRWAFSNGQPAATGQSTAVPMTIAGPVTATLTVLNSVGMVATGAAPTRAVTVTGAPTGNQAPTASISAPAGNTTITPGASVNFQGAGTDPDNNTPLTYAWSFPGGSPASSTAQNPGTVTYSAAGVFTATLIVKDSKALASPAVTRTVTVAAPGANQPPVASITAPSANTTVAPGGTVNFQGLGTDPDNTTPLTYKWSFPGGSPATSSAQNPDAVSYTTAGTYTASLIVTDAKGLASVPATLSVTVATVSQKLAAFIDTPCINVSVLPGGKVTFKGSANASANQPMTYNWRFIGGNPSSSKVQNPGPVSYTDAGVFNATLTVTDSKGAKSEAATRVVTVASANQAAPKVGMCSIVKDDDDEDDDDEDDKKDKKDKEDD